MALRIIQLLVLLSSFISCVGLAEDADALEALSFKQREHQAIVVGINAYTHRYVEQLEFAVNDARRLERSLSALGYDVTVLTDDQATPERILDAIRIAGDRLTQAPASRQGNLVFAFSGHGFSQGNENYLGTVHTDPSQLANSSLSITALKDGVSQANVKRSFLFIDACRRDPGKDFQGPGRRFVFDDQAEGVAILYSTAPDTLSYEDLEYKAGLFSYFLAEALNGSAADSAGNLSFSSVERFVVDRVVEHSTKRYGRTQRPYIAGERSGLFTLGHVSRVAKELQPETPVDQPPKPRGFTRTLKTLGVLALAAGLAKTLSDNNDETRPNTVSFVIPTP